MACACRGRMRSPVPAVLVSVACSAGFLGCAGDDADMIRARAASDFRCDEGKIAVRQIGELDRENALFEARACGHVARYRCTKTFTPGPESGTRVGSGASIPYTSCTLERPPEIHE